MQVVTLATGITNLAFSGVSRSVGSASAINSVTISLNAGPAYANDYLIGIVIRIKNVNGVIQQVHTFPFQFFCFYWPSLESTIFE